MIKNNEKPLNGLVIVAAETHYLTAFVDPRKRNRLRRVFDKIAETAQQYQQQKQPVYFVAERSPNIRSAEIYPPLRPFIPPKNFFKPQSPTEAQLLHVKERLIKDNVRRTELAGVSYQLCVRDLNALLDNDLRVPQTSSFTFGELVPIADRMGWSAHQLHDVVTAPFATRINLNLTDAVVWGKHRIPNRE